MVNGRCDNFFPLETSQNVMFRFVGNTEKGQTARGVGGETHPALRPDAEGDFEILDWLDKYQGPSEVWK
jgi:hypothetical protein